MLLKRKKPEKIRSATDEYTRLMELYRKELKDHSISIQSFAMLVKYHGLITILKDYVLNEIGIGDGICMCGFCFPNIFEPREKETEENYFESGVLFNFTYDGWTEVITNEEFVWLIEDAAKIYIEEHPEGEAEIKQLLIQVRDKFLNK